MLSVNIVKLCHGAHSLRKRTRRRYIWAFINVKIYHCNSNANGNAENGSELIHICANMLNNNVKLWRKRWHWHWHWRKRKQQRYVWTDFKTRWESAAIRILATLSLIIYASIFSLSVPDTNIEVKLTLDESAGANSSVCDLLDDVPNCNNETQISFSVTLH